MAYLKKLLKPFIYMLISLLIGTLLLTLINYINSGFIFKSLKLIIPIISMFIGGFMIGKRSIKKGWLEGIKIGLIFIFILVLYNLIILNNPFTLKTIIYYLILLSISVVGSMLGINKKIDK